MAKTTKTKKSQQESVDKKQKVVKKNKEIKEKKVTKAKATIKETEELFMPEPVNTPGPVNMDLAAAVQPLVKPSGELDSRVKIEDLINKAPKEVQKNPKELSYTAKKWDAYLQYTKWEPEAFLAKYPGHKFKEFIQEIIDFKKENV